MWLDWFDYGQHVILHDRQIPWEEPPKLINFMQQGQSLLDLDVVGLPLDKYFSWWLAQHPDLLESMAGRKRVGFALKTFLANGALRQSLLELIRSASSALSVPVALMLPSPRQLLRWAHGTANNQEDTQVDEIMVDSAAVYLTDFLRTFSETTLGGILLFEPEGVQIGDNELSMYQPLINICDAYHWTIGLHSPEAIKGNCSSLDFVVNNNPGICSIVLTPVEEVSWSRGVLSDTLALYSRIPSDANPENVLNTIKSLHS